jgi:uncharacterized protein YraI
MLHFNRLALACLAFLAFALPAAAAEVGTRAWLINGQSLMEGPGTAYDVVGELGDETRVRVDRCTYQWCLLHAEGQKGWASRDNISFGQHPRGPLTGPRLNYPSGATICLYEGRNFTGDSVCMKPGTVVHDLLLFDTDNRYSSVEVNGGSVTLCRNRNFSSYCERVVEDQASLNGFLDNGVSSVRVW